MKKTKTIIGAVLLAQSLAFFILFLIYWGKKKSLAQTFAAFSAVGGVAGAYLLVTGMGACKYGYDLEDDEIDEDFADLDICEDDIICSFDEDEETAE